MEDTKVEKVVIGQLLELARESMSAARWSQAVEIGRSGEFVPERSSADEIVVRVRPRGRPVALRVTIWPLEESWTCDCGDRDDPCPHIAAVVIALKNDLITERPVAALAAKRIEYHFTRAGTELRFERRLRDGETARAVLRPLREEFGESVFAYADNRDLQIDQMLAQSGGRGIAPRLVPLLLKPLAGLDRVWLNGEPIRTDDRQEMPELVVADAEGGIRCGPAPDETLFTNGALLRGSVLAPCPMDHFHARELPYLSPGGETIPDRRIIEFASEELPLLEKRFTVRKRSDRLPKVVPLRPEIELTTDRAVGGAVTALARIVYGSPAIASIENGRLFLLEKGVVPTRERGAEDALVRRLRLELNLQPNRPTVLSGEELARFSERAPSFKRKGAEIPALVPEVRIDGEKLDLVFRTGEGETIEGEQVLEAFRHGGLHVLLGGGGWGKVPMDWLERYGPILERLLAFRDIEKRVDPVAAPELLEISEALKLELPLSLRSLAEALRDPAALEPAPLPENFTGSLRAYQERGVAWLSTLARSGVGALLADDMGLGKTVQVLASISGRTLVVAPTSVIGSWVEQASRFRPGIRINRFHGSKRTFDSNAELVVTSYSLLRLELDRLRAESWDTIVLDEAQTIKNPDSQVARAAHELRGRFRVALSGTPVENRLTDLWSEFRFLNPALLGELPDFQRRYADPEAAGRLRSIVRPFVMRRVKREVARELPPRTEVVKRCELDTGERDLYDALLSSARREVTEKLASGGGILAALELILRLRQACCHPSLVPGQAASRSSKLDLLMELITEMRSEGHRALVFSQWTSLLDRIGPELDAAGVPYVRLDGSTADRDGVVSTFQSEDGPPVMLLSLKAGGTGLTLTRADHVFLMDPWWNPAVEDQAADRAHRIGQENPVIIHRLIAEDTIEERILALQAEKRRLADAVLEGGGAAAGLGADDILALLG